MPRLYVKKTLKSFEIVAEDDYGEYSYCCPHKEAPLPTTSKELLLEVFLYGSKDMVDVIRLAITDGTGIHIRTPKVYCMYSPLGLLKTLEGILEEYF